MVNTVFAEIFVVLVLILDVTFITKFKKLNNWRCTAQHAGLPRLFRNIIPTMHMLDVNLLSVKSGGGLKPPQVPTPLAYILNFPENISKEGDCPNLPPPPLSHTYYILYQDGLTEQLFVVS